MNTLIDRRSEPMLHLRFEGRSLDIPLRDLDLPALPREVQLRAAVAAYLDVAESKMTDYVVEHHPSGNWTIRPEAVFG
jgi:hypothetical protein